MTCTLLHNLSLSKVISSHTSSMKISDYKDSEIFFMLPHFPALTEDRQTSEVLVMIESNVYFYAPFRTCSISGHEFFPPSKRSQRQCSFQHRNGKKR